MKNRKTNHIKRLVNIRMMGLMEIVVYIRIVTTNKPEDMHTDIHLNLNLVFALSLTRLDEDKGKGL